MSTMKTLADVAEKITVGHVGSTSEYYVDDGVSFLRTQNVGQRQIIRKDIKQIKPEFHKKLKKSTLRTGDIVLSRVISDKINCAVVPCDLDGANCANIIIVRPGTDIDSQYLMHFIGSSTAQKALLKRRVGSAQSVVNTQVIKSWEVPLPPLPEQERIAALLDKADRLRRLRRYALQLGDSYLQSVFLEMFGDPVSNPMGWEEEFFGKICAIDAEMVDPRKEKYKRLLHIGSANIESVTGRLVNLETAEKDGLISSNFLITPGNILFSKIRPRLRKVAYPRMHGLCSADIYPVRVTSSKCNVLYLLHWLRSPQFTSIVAERAEARAQIPKVNRTELSRISVPLPDVTLQEKFAQIVKRYERLRSQQRESLRQAEHLFESLMKSSFDGGV